MPAELAIKAPKTIPAVHVVATAFNNAICAPELAINFLKQNLDWDKSLLRKIQVIEFAASPGTTPGEGSVLMTSIELQAGAPLTTTSLIRASTPFSRKKIS